MQAGQPTSNRCRGGSGVISQCFNSEMSLLSSRPRLPKINYDDLHMLTLQMQHTILWIMSPSLRLSSRFVILNGVWRLVSFARSSRTMLPRVPVAVTQALTSLYSISRCHWGCFLQQQWNGVLVIINNKTIMQSKKCKSRNVFKKMAYNWSTSISFTLAGGSGNDVITDYVNPLCAKPNFVVTSLSHACYTTVLIQTPLLMERALSTWLCGWLCHSYTSRMGMCNFFNRNYSFLDIHLLWG